MNIPEELLDIVQFKAAILGVTPEQVLEYMVKEYTPSTQEERSAQIKARNDARQKFLMEHVITPASDIWYNGWRTGWEQFQTRKFSQMFKREESVPEEK